MRICRIDNAAMARKCVRPLKWTRALSRHAHERFVHESRGLKCLPRALASDVVAAMRRNSS